MYRILAGAVCASAEVKRGRRRERVLRETILASGAPKTILDES